jgi:hypothetical protein
MNIGKAPVFPVLYLSFCLAVSLVFSSCYEMSEFDIFSSCLRFESQDLDGWNATEKFKWRPFAPCINPFLPAISFLSRRSFFVFPVFPADRKNSSLRC